MGEQLTKLRPDRDLQCYFERPSAVAALSETSASGFTVSGRFRQQFDWAVVEWNRDNVFEHPAVRCLPDGDLSGLRLSYDERRQGCVGMDCRLWPTVDWPYLRIWATGADGVEDVYKVPLLAHATPIEANFEPARAVFELRGTVTGGDWVELAWEAGDGVPASARHATHMMFYDETLEGVAELLADAVNGNSATSGMTANAEGQRITLEYSRSAGANGNRIGAYGNVSGAGTESWEPGYQKMSGGISPVTWHVELDFSNLEGYVGPDFKTLAQVPTRSVRRMRWTWAPEQQQGDFAQTEFQVTVSNWMVSGTAPYQVAGPGSWRVEDDSDSLAWVGTWDDRAIGNYSGGSIRPTQTPGAAVSYTYSATGSHTLYLGSRKFGSNPAGPQISIRVDGNEEYESLAFGGQEDVLLRIKVAELGAGQHTVTTTHAGGGTFYFDFYEIAYPALETPTFPPMRETTLATDWDTDHSIALAPERTAWLIRTLGFEGRANHYAGAMWFYEMTRPGHEYASATVTFTGSPTFGAYTSISIGGALFEHLTLKADTTASVVKSLEYVINAGATAVWAQAEGATLRIRSRTMGVAGNGMTVVPDTGENEGLTASASGGLEGGLDGNAVTLPWAQGWRTDLEAVPRINRAARDWHRSYFRALKGYGIDAAAAFSMELQHGDPGGDTGIAQRYPDGSPALLNTPALQTNFSPASLAFWKQVYLDMADVMNEAGMAPFLQFGEVQWWYFASTSGMPFYDEYATGAFRAAYGRSMRVIASQFESPEAFPDECEFLQRLIGRFTQSVMESVRFAHPSARFESLYPLDTNDTPLNRVINYPASYWTPSSLACLKTESFGYTGSRNLDRALDSIEFPMELGFPPTQSSHLAGIGDYTTPWQKERRLALERRLESMVLFALDQFCLIGYELPLERGQRRARRMGP